jgi:hypothetical protein
MVPLYTYLLGSRTVLMVEVLLPAMHSNLSDIFSALIITNVNAEEGNPTSGSAMYFTSNSKLCTSALHGL